MSKMLKELRTDKDKKPPKGLFRPCVVLDSGPHQVEEDVGSLDRAMTICLAYSYGRPAVVYDDAGRKHTV